MSITPYFLEKGCVWFKENLKKILQARKTQSFFEDNTLFIEQGESLHFSQFLRTLDEMGYEKVQAVETPGEFSQRGGIIDIFPINTTFAFRLEFFGNRIEQIAQLPVTIEDEKTVREILKKRIKSQKLFSDLKGLKPGDYLVHLDHGIGQFSGIENSYYILAYAKGDKLSVPLGLERKLSRYVGFVEPKVSRLSSPFWQQTKRKAKEGAEAFAKELLELYAKRQIATRLPYNDFDEFASYIAATFPYEETPDQKETIEDIRKDLEKPEPMDRIVCGDVGFGKTEVALRAMVKVVQSGNRAVMLCPTTILAYQHFHTIKARIGTLPITTALVTRLQSKKEREQSIKDIQKGTVDIIIGTHRLLSDDIAPILFKEGERGLLVIDDEQRFGVKQKEKLKNMRSALDMLSLSATPIPRTLHLALSSFKNISIIQTPPEGRLPVKTYVLPYAQNTIQQAIKDEMSRAGQVYYLHNRVETIEFAKKEIKKLIPGIRVGIAHGRMREKELIGVMRDFQDKNLDVLIATTIIENGLDIPNVNTLIVADAPRLGLSQAYQIRGRIGRSHRQATAYFLYTAHLSEKAQMRLQALKEAEALGSGYHVALKDLEMRGAGNILGREQSGSINQVGLNLYCQMVSEAVEKLKSSK